MLNMNVEMGLSSTWLPFRS